MTKRTWAGGPVVQLKEDDPNFLKLQEIENKGYFLRDDLTIRQGCEVFKDQEQAYSLFQDEPYGRVAVYGGTLDWAINEALKEIRLEC